MFGSYALRRDLTLPRVTRHEQALEGVYIQRPPSHVGSFQRGTFLPSLFLEIFLEMLILPGVLQVV
jgi:hypothetical protein